MITSGTISVQFRLFGPMSLPLSLLHLVYGYHTLSRAPDSGSSRYPCVGSAAPEAVAGSQRAVWALGA